MTYTTPQALINHVKAALLTLALCTLAHAEDFYPTENCKVLADTQGFCWVVKEDDLFLYDYRSDGVVITQAPRNALGFVCSSVIEELFVLDDPLVDRDLFGFRR